MSASGTQIDRRPTLLIGLGLTPSVYVLVAALTGAAFIRWSRLDLWVTGRYWNATEGFFLGDSWWAVAVYEGVPIVTITVAVLLVGGLVHNLLRKEHLGPFTTRVLLFLLVGLAAGPGLVVNWLFKGHWGRPRPRDVVEFGGSMEFMPALVPGGACERNCSFVAGHPSSVFWLAAFGFLVAGRLRYTVFAAASLAGLVVGWGRLVQGAHFLSDVVFSGVFTFATVYVLARWVFRVPPKYGVALVTAWAALVGGIIPLSAHAQEIPPGEGAPADHVIMISVDGLRPDFYLQDRWPAPVMQRMAREGAHAEGVRGVFPSVTYPSHTTLITGALPARHGIYYNTPFEPGGQTGRWYWEYESVRVETLWEAAREAGLTTAGVGWPVTVGAPIDWNVPEFWSLDPDVTFRDALQPVAAPEGWLEELEREATGRLVARDSAGMATQPEYAWWDGRKTDIAEYLIATRQPGFMAIHLVATDGAQHARGREHWDVERAVASVDHAIGRLVEAVESNGLADRTTFLIVGDHGFVDYHRVLHPNAWLVEAGLTGDYEDRGDWSASFHVAGGAAFLHLADPSEGASLERVRDLLASQPEEVLEMFRVLEREELQSMGADPRVAMALTAARGVAFNPGSGPQVVRERSGGTHGYWPDFHPNIYTGFVAWGAGVRDGARTGILPMEDIAPYAAALLGLDLDAQDGRVPHELRGSR